MPNDLMARLADPDQDFTSAENAIASYIRANRTAVAFETAASLAQKLDVSAVTVGRFCRRLGYPHFKALKADLKMDVSGVPWLVGPQLESFVDRSKKHGEFRRSLELDVAGIVEVYSMVGTPAWDAIIELLANAKTVFVAGFQTERAIAALLSHLLQYVRPDVFLADLSAGNFADALVGRDRGCIVIIETRRYSKQALQLAEVARRMDQDLILLTDKYCDWAGKFTPHVISVSTDSDLFWNSEVPLACAVNLLANSVVARLGRSIEPRLQQYSDLYQTFTGHHGKAGPQRVRKTT